MKKTEYKPTFIGYIEPGEGQSIEIKCAKLIENNEPITDGAPIIYTEKKDGVRPEFDIRTDRWEIAQSAMDLANASKIAKSKGIKNPEETKPEETKPEETKPTETKTTE